MKSFTIILIVILLAGCITQVEYPLKTREEALPGNAVKMTPETDFFPPILHSDEWEPPTPVKGLINTPGGEDSPFILPDGSTLFFFFTPDVTIPAQEQLTDGVTGIYVTYKKGNQWSTPQRVILNDPNKLSLEGCPFVQNNILWFCSVREGGCRDIDIYTAEFKNGEWVNWKNAGEKLNCDYGIGELHISSDQNEMYFHSLRPGGKGQYDIWVIKKVDGEWQPPINVDSVNTPENEGWPFLTEDGTELWFTRTYMGTPGVFRSRKVNSIWGEPELIISQFAGEPTLDNAGNIYFVHHFYEDGTMIEADIYVCYRKHQQDPFSLKPQNFLNSVNLFRYFTLYLLASITYAPLVKFTGDIYFFT